MAEAKSPTLRRRIVRTILFLPLWLLVAYFLLWPGSAADKDSARLAKQIPRLVPLHETKRKPQPGDWLDRHKERGQTFAQYLRYRPIRPTAKRNTIYLVRLGDFKEKERKALDQTAEFTKLYFGLPVKFAKDIPLSVIPESARRVHPNWGMKQILSTYVLDKILKPRVPKDAVVLMCFTPIDLYPADDWNFVFGQASIRQRVGVQSLYRNGDPDKEYPLYLRRTIKTATHETGHMFSLLHCIAYECNMNGSNHRQESDRSPLWLCPECNAKVCWSIKLDPIKRFESLRDWCKKNGLTKEQELYQKSIDAVGRSD